MSEAARRLAGVPDDAPRYDQRPTMGRVLRDKWHRASNIGELQVSYEKALDGLPRASINSIADWMAEYPHNQHGLLLTGNNGSGKTTLAKAIAHQLIAGAATLADLGRTEEYVPHQPVLFVSWTDYLNDVKRRMSLENRKDFGAEFADIDLRIASIALETKDPEWVVRLAVLDDIGNEYDTGAGWVNVELNKVLRARGHAGLLSIATSNVALSKWSAKYGPGVGSYAYEAFTEVVIASEDRRRR